MRSPHGRGETHLLLERGEVNSDPWRQGLGVPKVGFEREGELLQVFPLDVSERGLREPGGNNVKETTPNGFQNVSASKCL